MGLVKVLDAAGIDRDVRFDLVPHLADEFQQMRAARGIVEAAMEVLIECPLPVGLKVVTVHPRQDGPQVGDALRTRNITVKGNLRIGPACQSYQESGCQNRPSASTRHALLMAGW